MKLFSENFTTDHNNDTIVIMVSSIVATYGGRWALRAGINFSGHN